MIYSGCVDERRVITASEAEACLGVKASRVRQWACRRRLYAVAIGPKGERWYRLDEILALAA